MKGDNGVRVSRGPGRPSKKDKHVRPAGLIHKKVILSSSDEESESQPAKRDHQKATKKKSSCERLEKKRSPHKKSSVSKTTVNRGDDSEQRIGLKSKKPPSHDHSEKVEADSAKNLPETEEVDAKTDRSAGGSHEEDEDIWGGFKFVRRETDGFKKGYKAVRVSVVTEHPVAREVVGVVVFRRADGTEFAQYIPLREIHENAPMELRQYFLRVNSLNDKNIMLSLLLHTTKKTV